DGVIPKAEAMRLPVQYLANLFTAGKTEYVTSALNRLIAMRSYMRSVNVDGKPDTRPLQAAGLDEHTAKQMYRYLAIANYEDRFLIPTSHGEIRLTDYYGFQSQNGFPFGNDTSPGVSPNSLFPERRRETVESREPAPLAPRE